MIDDGTLTSHSNSPDTTAADPNVYADPWGFVEECGELLHADHDATTEESLEAAIRIYKLAQAEAAAWRNVEKEAERVLRERMADGVAMYVGEAGSALLVGDTISVV